MSELDIEDSEALVAYLRALGHAGPDELPRIQVLRGGVSNRTVWVGRSSGEAWVMKQALRKLRVAVEWISAPERIEREALGMRWLAALLPAGTVPRLIFEDPSQYLLAMAAVPEPHRNWKSVLLEGDVRSGHVEQFARILACMHWNSHLRREEAARAFGDTSFFESLRLEPYYQYAASQVPAAAPFLAQLVGETRVTKLCIVHGDFSPKNILVHEGRLILLDHEVIHFGDPAFDLGFSVTHLLSKAHHVASKRALFAEAAGHYWATYCAAIPDPRWPRELEARAVRHTLACLLARVDGRSPLEYLTAEERGAQHAAVLALMESPPRGVNHLIGEFVRRLP